MRTLLDEESVPQNVSKSMQLISPDFLNGGEIPKKFTCDGDNVSPNLEIQGVPKETRSLAIVLDDPDAPSGTFTHWLIWNISPVTDKIESGVLPKDAREGLNSVRTRGYVGPCPPSGTHNYIFKLYALRNVFDDLEDEVDREKLRELITGNIVAEAELVGLYSRN